MAIIQSGNSASLLTIDTTSLAARTTLYDVNGNVMSDVASLNNVLNGLNAAVTITLGGQSTVGFNVASTSGTLTLSFEATMDNTNWFSINATPVAGGSTVTSTTANGQWVSDLGGMYAVRARISAFTSGSMTVSLIVTPQNSKLVSQAVTGTVSISGAVTVSGTVTSNQGTPNTLANAWSVEVTDGTNVLGTSGHPIRIDPTGTTTQPVSGTVTANIGTTNGLALDTSVNGILVSQGSTTSGEKGPLIQGAVTTSAPSYTTAQTSPLSLTTAGALRIDGSAVTQPVSGTVTANAGTGTFTVGGTVTANIGTTNGLALDTSVNGILVSQGSTTSGEKGPLIQGAVTTSAPTYTTAQTSPLSLTTAGALRIDGSAVTQPVSGTVTANAGTGNFTVVQATAANLNATVTGTVTSNQGTANSLANAWPTEITDGTHGPAAVKAASTAAVSTDPSLVVALNPNTPTPVAADNIGSGTITTLGGAVQWGVQGYSGQTVQVSGSWTGTLTFEFSIDGGTTWWNDTVETGTGTFSSTTTANGIFINLGIGAYGKYRLVSTGGAFTGTATVAWDASTGNNILGAQALISDGSNNGPVAVKPASTAPVAADPALVVAMSTNSIAAQDRSAIVQGTKHIAVTGGSDNGIARAIRIGEFGTQRTTSEVTVWHDAIEGTTVNAFWTQSTTTQTIAQTTGVVTLNNSNITTLNTDAIITSQRQFPKYPRNPLYVRFRANITANAAANHTLVEMGLGAPSGVTATINNGAFFRWTAAGNLNAVTSFNGTETSTQILAQGTISTTSYLYYDVVIDDDYARFIVSDSSGTPIVDTQVDISLTAPFISAVSHLPSFARVYVDATGGGTAIQLKISAHSVQMLDNLFGKTWAEQQSSMMRQASINPTTYAQTGSSMTAAPATETPSNTAGGYNALGGDFATALTVASENPLSVFAFTIPSPYSFYLTGLTFSLPVVTTAISVTGLPWIEWLVIANCASGNISTGGGQRFPVGINHFYTSITQAAGVSLNLGGGTTAGAGATGGPVTWSPKVPILCLPGTTLHIAYKVFVTSAAGTPGVTRGSIFVDGFFE